MAAYDQKDIAILGEGSSSVMDDHAQKDVDAIFARGSRKHIPDEQLRQPPSGVSSLQILDAIQPSLTRPYPTAHLESFLQIRQNREGSRTATVAIDSDFRNNATEQYAGGTLHGPSIFQQHTAFVSVPKQTEDDDRKITSSKTSPNFGDRKSSLPAGDLNLLSDASLNITLAQHMLCEDDLTNGCTIEASTPFTQECIILDSLEGKQSSGLHGSTPRVIQDSSQQKKQLHQHHAPIEPQELMMVAYTTCADRPTSTPDLSKPHREFEASIKVKARTSREQALLDEEDAKAEREMYDMDHDYQNQMEARRQKLAKMERQAEIKRGIASATDARRVVESRAAASIGNREKPGRKYADGSVLPSVICEEVSDRGKRRIAKDTLPVYPPTRCVSQAGITAPPHSLTQDKIRETLSRRNDPQKFNGDMAENRKYAYSSLDRQSDANRKLRIAAQQIGKQMAERDRNRDQERQKLTAKSLHDCHSFSPLPSRTPNVSYDQRGPKSTCVIETSQMDHATHTTADVLKAPGTVVHRANTSPLVTAEPVQAIHSNVDALPRESPRKSSTTIDTPNETVYKSNKRSMIMENQILSGGVQNDESKPSRSMSTQISPNDSESIPLIGDVTTDLPQSQHNSDNTNSLRPSEAAETTLWTLVNSEQTSSKTKGKTGRNEEDFISKISEEIATRHESIHVKSSSNIGEYTLDSVTSPTILGNHGNDHAGSVHREDSNSLFGDSRSDTEDHEDIAERYQLTRSSKEPDIEETGARESQQGSKIVGQWAIVEADNSKDDVNQTSMKDAENLLIMQMLDIESKKSHTRTISARNPIQQYASNKRQKLGIHARALAESKNETVHQDNSMLIHQPIEQEVVGPRISNNGRRTRMTTPERKDANRLTATKHQQKKKRDTLQQGPQSSNQSTSEQIALHAISSGLSKHQAQGKPQARGFAALNGTPITKSRKISGLNAAPGAGASQHKNVPLSRRNMHLSSDKKIVAIKNHLSAYETSDIRDVDVPEDDDTDVEVLSFGQKGPPLSHVYESFSSSDEDESEEQAKQRRLLKYSGSAPTSEVSCNQVPATPESGRSTYARKGIGRKTIDPKTCTDDGIRENAGPEAEPVERDGSTASDSDNTTEEALLWHYTVNRRTRQSSASAANDTFLDEPRGTFLTKAEANKVATTELHHLLRDAPLENAVTLRTDAAGLQTCLLTTPSTDVHICVTRALARKARLPASAARLPRLVYGVTHRVIRRYRAPAVPDTYDYLHVGTFSLLDLANRAAGRAWLAHELRQLPPGAYAQEVQAVKLRNTMREGLDVLETEGGFFRRKGRWVKGAEEAEEEAEEEEEVEVWVDEREVQGPRN